MSESDLEREDWARNFALGVMACFLRGEQSLNWAMGSLAAPFNRRWYQMENRDIGQALEELERRDYGKAQRRRELREACRERGWLE